MFTIDPRKLGRASRDPIRHGLDLDEDAQIPTPQVEPLSTPEPIAWERSDGPR